MIEKRVDFNDQNPEKNLFVMTQDIVKIASDRGVSVTEVIDELIEDLNNFRNTDYQNKVEEIVIDGDVSDKLLNNLKAHFTRMKKTFKVKEKKVSKQENAKTRNVEIAMIGIQEIVNREYNVGNIKNKASYLTKIKESIIGNNKDIDLNVKIGKKYQQHLISRIDDIITKEKDELYFEQVKNFTKGFQFLRDYPEVEKVKHGASKINKFTDLESYNRFTSLRELLQNEYNENIGIQMLLESGKITDADAKILCSRKEVLDREIEEKRKTGEIR